MYYNKETQEDFSIPLLSDLPILGILFEGKSLKTDRHEVIFTITPKVLCNN